MPRALLAVALLLLALCTPSVAWAATGELRASDADLAQVGGGVPAASATLAAGSERPQLDCAAAALQPRRPHLAGSSHDQQQPRAAASSGWCGAQFARPPPAFVR